MLSFRLAIFAAVSGIALWGLFSLLQTLREPQLLRSAKAVVIKGCATLESSQARSLCPQLFCQKHLLDTRLAPQRARFEVTVDKRDRGTRLIAGKLQAEPEAEQGFACIVRNSRVMDADVLDLEELAAVSLQAGDFVL